MASGAWIEFWDALLLLRSGRPPAPTILNRKNSLPSQALVAELQRAYTYFNARLLRRGKTLIQDLNPDRNVFNWKTEPDKGRYQA
jgi:hypothetical protein